LFGIILFIYIFHRPTNLLLSRDNISYLTQVSLPRLPDQVYIYKYILTYIRGSISPAKPRGAPAA
jgi:hypothetical protein